METPIMPHDEAERLASLRALNVLDTTSEERYDRLTRLAASIMDVPIALVSLVDTDRQWFKSKFGLDAIETPRDISFCGHTILGDELFEISNALEDTRFADNPLVVDAPNIRFYAGQPLRTPNGFRIGTLCVIDIEPRELTVEQRNLLGDLARLVEQELIIHDITELQKRMLKEQRDRRIYQKRLEESEVRFRTLAGATTEGIAISELGTVVDANQSLAGMLGYDLDTLTGLEITSLIQESERDKIRQEIKDAQNSTTRCAGLNQDGTEIPLEIFTNETMYNGKSARVTVFRDLREQHKIDRMKNEFVSNVSHELRTPLTSIQGSLGLILGGLTGEMSQQLKELLEIAHKNSSRLIQLINDILDIQKIESGQMDFQYSAESVNDIVQESISENQPYAERYNVSFDFVPPGESHSVSVDPTRIKQVLSNLLSNAAKFSPKGGNVKLSINRKDDWVEIRVKDNGPGIPDEFRPKVFERFSQAEASGSRPRGGTGLGLSITKVIVERMGGEIGFETEVGKGSEFYFTLPLITATSEQIPVLDRDRVLICEDNLGIADIIKTLLERAGHTCDVAHTAADAQMLLDNNDYLAMTLDITLPDKDGLTFLRELRQSAKTRDMPVIIISAYDDSALEMATVEAGAMGIVNWLQKPVDYGELLDVFRKIRIPNYESRTPR
ncbi:MAG: response regulator, partial [Candidatus Latescibacteria bacterium]|nr:response regulator [Candidatus Latescibacterota bacterium]